MVTEMPPPNNFYDCIRVIAKEMEKQGEEVGMDVEDLIETIKYAAEQVDEFGNAIKDFDKRFKNESKG